MLKIKLVASIPQPLGFLSCALFNVRKVTNFKNQDALVVRIYKDILLAKRKILSLET